MLKENLRIGIDSGATLCKIAIADGDTPVRYEVLPSGDPGVVAHLVNALGAEAVGITGGGAARLQPLIKRACVVFDEFESWRLGIEYLTTQDETLAGRLQHPFLVASMGTGTLVLKIDGSTVTRIGGTSLGGGSILGLCRLLIGVEDFATIQELAEAGDASNVDTRISDVYPDGGFGLPGNITAVAFGKIARAAGDIAGFAPRDIVAALMRLVGEQIGRLLADLSEIHAAGDIVIGGSVVSHNPVMNRALRTMLMSRRRRAVFVNRGQYVGAIGAMLAGASRSQ